MDQQVVYVLTIVVVGGGAVAYPAYKLVSKSLSWLIEREAAIRSFIESEVPGDSDVFFQETLENENFTDEGGDKS